MNAKRDSNRRVHSSYLDELEDWAAREVAAANGTTPNAVIRIALRRLLGLPAVSVEIPDRVRARLAE